LQSAIATKLSFGRYADDRYATTYHHSTLTAGAFDLQRRPIPTTKLILCAGRCFSQPSCGLKVQNRRGATDLCRCKEIGVDLELDRNRDTTYLRKSHQIMDTKVVITKAPETTIKLNLRIRLSYACAQLSCWSLSNVRFAVPTNPLAFTHLFF